MRLVEPPYIVCLSLDLWYTPGRVRCGSTSDTLSQSYIFSFSCSIPLRVRYNFGTAPSWLRQYSKFCHDRSPSPCDLIGGELTEYRKREGGGGEVRKLWPIRPLILPSDHAGPLLGLYLDQLCRKPTGGDLGEIGEEVEVSLARLAGTNSPYARAQVRP